MGVKGFFRNGINKNREQAASGFTLARNEKGVTLIETLVALAIFGLVGAAFLSGLAASAKAVMISQERVYAESLAKSQIESIKSENYTASDPYTKIEISSDLAVQGYDIDWPPTVTQLQAGLQKIIITVNRNGDAILTIEDYKVER